MAVDLAPDLLEILACPNCHSRLAVDHDRSELVCTGTDCALAYPVRDQIPILLIDEARAPERTKRADGESPASDGDAGADSGSSAATAEDASTATPGSAEE